MRIFDVEPTIGELDGFKPEVDIFKRAKIGEGLTHLVMSVNQPLVIALDADWGSGKTVFLKMWAGELRKLGVPVIHFDAFANDYHHDAFLALAGEIIRLAQEKESAASPNVRRLTDRAIGVGKIIARSAGKIIVKAVTRGALNGDEAVLIGKELAGDVVDETTKIADKYLEEVLAGANERKATIDGFRQLLSELPSLLSGSCKYTEASEANYPLVFIIDELDRCIPPFALQILERVKHVFSVPHVHFVLGVHLDQLCNSVKVEYGPDIDARTYLEKFIHVTVPLVDTAEQEHDTVAKKYIDFLSRGIAAAAQDRHVELLNEFVFRYAVRNDLSLRALQKLYTIASLALAVANERTLFIAPLVGGLAILKLKHPKLYRKAKTGALTYRDVEKLFGFNETPNPARVQHDIEWAAGFWRFATDPDAPEELRKKYGQGLDRYNVSKERLLPLLANDLIDRYKPRDGRAVR